MIAWSSGPVKEQAETEGLDETFLKAGIEWSEPRCRNSGELFVTFSANTERHAPRSRRPLGLRNVEQESKRRGILDVPHSRMMTAVGNDPHRHNASFGKSGAQLVRDSFQPPAMRTADAGT
jgi:hypothetical protein